jgi:hypothetical protein
VRAHVRMMRWFVREMRRQARLYAQALVLYLTDDSRESAAAFVEERKPMLRGR